MANIYVMEFNDLKDLNSFKQLKEKTMVYYSIIKSLKITFSSKYSEEIKILNELISKINSKIDYFENNIKKEKDINLENKILFDEDDSFINIQFINNDENITISNEESKKTFI